MKLYKWVKLVVMNSWSKILYLINRTFTLLFDTLLIFFNFYNLIPEMNIMIAFVWLKLYLYNKYHFIMVKYDEC